MTEDLCGSASGSNPPSSSLLTVDEVSRYARHLVVPEVGEHGQSKLKLSSVLVVGAGGLGSGSIPYLAAAGVGKIGIMDDDRVAIDNLARQIIHSTEGVGRLKVESASEFVQGLNPSVEIEVWDERLDEENAIEIVGNFDVVVDGTDNFPSRYIIDDACHEHNKPWVWSAVNQWDGQISVFNHKGGPRYRDLFPKPPPPEHWQTCVEQGVVSPIVGVMGSLEALEVMKVLLDVGDTLSGRLLLVDGLRGELRTVRFGR